MKTLFDPEKLVNHVYEEQGGTLSKQELTDLLSVGEDGYHRDSPASVGKGLKIISIEFAGSKQIDGNSSDFRYVRRFENGVYLWVGDNLVGKSSIFKVIKLALTGSKSLNKDVDSWIQEIWLEFSLGSKVYSVHINRPKQNNFQFRLINGSRPAEQIAGDVNQEETILFEGGISAYEEFMQTFFFREMDYYSLQWTQRSSQKDNPRLLTSNASWKTYFKSVYLEAEDYNVLVYGQQSELVFQMLLGLELTYPINRLKIKRDLLANELGLSKVKSNTSDQNTSQNEAEELKKKLASIDSELEQLTEVAKQAMKPASEDEKQFELVRKKYREAVSKRSDLEKLKDELDETILQKRRKYQSILRRLDDYAIDLGKKDKAINDIREYLEIGAFFSGLEVKSCPNCNHAVEKQKVVTEKSNGTCRLCEHEMSRDEIDEASYQNELEKVQKQKGELERDAKIFREELDEINQQLIIHEQTLTKLEREIEMLGIGHLHQQIVQYDQRLGNVKPHDWNDHLAKVTSFTAHKTVLEQTLKLINNNTQLSLEEQAQIENKIRAIEIAEEDLKRQREERSRGPVNIFEALYLNQLKSLGLPHYERVELKSNFKIAYHMHGNELDFDEISPGEQLRAKLGLYISLIEMDVEHQFGRHPRFIILDSPAKEEGDRRFVEGIATTLKFIQDNFGEQLQVFVGTAQRELTNSIDSERVEVRKENEFFF